MASKEKSKPDDIDQVFDKNRTILSSEKTLSKISASCEFKQRKQLENHPTAIKVKGIFPYKRDDLVKWNGWGYKDSFFVAINNATYFTGERYSICNKPLHYFLPWVEEIFGVTAESPFLDAIPDIPKNYKFPELKISKEQIDSLNSLNIKLSIDNPDRLYRSHGQANYEVISVTNNTIKRIPDVVMWPESHEDVVDIVKMANELNIVVVPFGGGTNVSGALECPHNEERPILSLDTTMMNTILWVDKECLLVCCQSGIVGQDLERELEKIGYTVGHQPDSAEFSTVGGWVATRASGMKKNTYGNIEDIVLNAKMVTPSGTLVKSCTVPRSSCGPDFNNVTLGSEGCFGVITEVTLKIRPCPPVKLFGSLVFPDFESGLKCFQEIGHRRCQPTSIRMMDNQQLRLGKSLREKHTFFGIVIDSLKNAFIEKIKRFDPLKMCITTILYEGEKDDVTRQEKKINAIAAKYSGVPAGKTNGERGYFMTFIIAHIRDVATMFGVTCESIESSVPWNTAQNAVDAVRSVISKECTARRFPHQVMCRIAQVYESGCCIYFYIAYKEDNSQMTSALLERLSQMARDIIITNGGSISHHHGVGKVKRSMYEQAVSSTGQELFKAIKHQLDPKNIFALKNMVENINFIPSKL